MGKKKVPPAASSARTAKPSKGAPRAKITKPTSTLRSVPAIAVASTSAASTGHRVRRGQSTQVAPAAAVRGHLTFTRPVDRERYGQCLSPEHKIKRHALRAFFEHSGFTPPPPPARP